LTVTIDSYDSTAAITEANLVTFDMSDSTGDGLSYRIDFGDGLSPERAVSQHVFSTAHSHDFQVRAMVTDRSGQSDVVTRKLPVSRLDGSGFCPAMWDHINTGSRPLVAHFRFTSQIGGRVAGQFERITPGALGRPEPHQFNGVLYPDGNLELTVDDSTRLRGFVGFLEPVGIMGLYHAGHMRLTASGGPLDGIQMDFGCHDPY
jgi:PKD domain-containing protein